MWKKCHSQYDVWFSFGRTELHFISLARCETGWMKLFTGDGLGAGENRMTTKISEPLVSRFFHPGSSEVVFLPYAFTYR